MSEERWEAERPVPCPRCGGLNCGPWHDEDGEPTGKWWCPGCKDWFPEPDDPRVEVVRASELERAVEALERAAVGPCGKFPKERQPSEWNCQLLRDDHRENAADYVDSANAAAEQLCDSCLARDVLGSLTHPSDPVPKETAS